MSTTTNTTTNSSNNNVVRVDVDTKKKDGWSNCLMVESWGDYRKEEFLEDKSSPLYRYQNKNDLPSLPVPSIDQTLERLVPTCLPLVSSLEEKESFLQAISKFPNQAKVLQQRLEQHATDVNNSDDNDDPTRSISSSSTSTSWLQHWWNTDGYLKVRDPSVVNVSYFFHFSPSNDCNPISPEKRMIHRAADMLLASAHYRNQVIQQTLPPTLLGRNKIPLCNVAYKYMFHACRIPHEDFDSYRLYNPWYHSHVIISCRGQFYSMPLFFETNTNNTTKVLSKSTLIQMLQHIVQISTKNTDENNNNNIELGWFTAQNRDDWAKARTELLHVGGEPMSQALKTLESGTLLLCLDDTEFPKNRQDCANIFWTGNISSTPNRWFDKSVQLFVTANGQAGLMGEHSMMDGMPMIGLADCIVNYKHHDNDNNDKMDSNYYLSQVTNIFEPVMDKLTSSSTTKIPKMLKRAKQNTINLINDHDLHVCNYTGYGASQIKKMGYSPDAYVQMAMQLATYRLWDGHQAATYEATQTRIFMHGRTETTRTVSPESAHFCDIMSSKASTVEEKRLALQKAVQTHSNYTRLASKGHGVDRHLLGLSYMVKNDDEMPDLFRHNLYIRSKTWRVSTSHLTHPKFDNWGYGEVVPHGLGLAYAIQKESCVFNLTALKKHNWTQKLQYLLEDALTEMKLLHQDDDNKCGGLPKSKL